MSAAEERGLGSARCCGKETGYEPEAERLTLVRIYEELRGRGYDDGYDAVRRYTARWSKSMREASADAYVPLSFDPCEAYQFEWSHEIAFIDGITTTIKVAHVRLWNRRRTPVPQPASPGNTQNRPYDPEPQVDRHPCSNAQDARTN